MNSKLYAIVFTKTGEVLDAASFKEYWKNYGSNQLYGWRKPKKIYDNLGAAKRGFAHVPAELKPHLSIAEFCLDKVVLDGGELAVDQARKRLETESRKQERRAAYELQQAERELAAAQRRLAELKK